MSLSKEAVLAKLASGEFEGLVGELETGWLECKQSPYQLDTDRQKLELAKDIAGLANASGGLLLLGFATAKDVTHGADRIDCVNPFPLEVFNADRYAAIANTLTWPAVDIFVDVYPIGNGSAVASIAIHAASPIDRPVLVAKVIVDDDKFSGIGYVLDSVLLSSRRRSHATKTYVPI